MHTIRRLAARTIAAVLLIPVLAVPAPAAALCGGEPDPNPMSSIDPDSVVFVGTAVETRSNDFSALFHVKEVWVGGPVSEWQPVIGFLPESEFRWIEDAAEWTVGTEYLVVTHHQGDMLLGAGTCISGNRPYTAELAAYRPERVFSPVPADRPPFRFTNATQEDYSALLVGPGVLLVALAGWGLWLWRRPRRQARSPRP